MIRVTQQARSQGKKNRPSGRRAQSLIEALVALSILTTGMVGIMTLLTKSFSISRTISEQTQGTYLAAEGIEIMKNLIDHDVYLGLSLSTSTDDFANCFSAGTTRTYMVDYTFDDTVSDITLNDCPSAVSPLTAQTSPLYLNNSTHLYSYTSAGATKTEFSRAVSVTLSADGNVLTVSSAVYWTGGSITLEDDFYNWHPGAL